MISPRSVCSEGHIFLHLTAKGYLTVDALRHEANKSIILDGRVGAVQSSSSRETTPAPSDHGDGEKDQDFHLILSFDRAPKDQSVGYSIGCGTACDVVLRKVKGNTASNMHLVIEVREENAIFLRDASRYGTNITYYLPNEKFVSGATKRDHSLCLYRDEPLASEVGIQIGRIKFNISFPDHQDTRLAGEFRSRLVDFYRRRHSAVPNVALMGLESQPTTAAPSQPETPHMASQAPQMYLDRCVISQTKWSVIWRTTDARTGYDVVAKRLRVDYVTRARAGQKRKAADPKSIHGRFEQEADLMRTFEHPNLMRLYEFVTGEAPTIYMPWYPDGDLGRYELTSPQCDSMAIQLMRALESLHGNGIMHRDVKPANVLVDTRGVGLKFILTDFNLATKFDPVDCEPVPRHRTFCGTPRYAAPEQMNGESTVVSYDETVDLYSAGILYIEARSHTPLVSGLSSEPGKRHADVVEAVRTQATEDLDRRVAQIRSQSSGQDVPWMMLKTVDPSPNERWSAARCLGFCIQHGLAKLVDGPGEVTAENLELRKVGAGSDLDTEVPTKVLSVEDSAVGSPPTAAIAAPPAPAVATIIRDVEPDEPSRQPDLSGSVSINKGRRASLTASGWPEDLEGQLFPKKADSQVDVKLTEASPTVSQLSAYANAVAERFAGHNGYQRGSQRGIPTGSHADSPETLDGSNLPEDVNEQTPSLHLTGSGNHSSFGRLLHQALSGQPPTTASLPSTATASPLLSLNASMVSTPSGQ